MAESKVARRRPAVANPIAGATPCLLRSARGRPQGPLSGGAPGKGSIKSLQSAPVRLRPAAVPTGPAAFGWGRLGVVRVASRRQPAEPRAEGRLRAARRVAGCLALRHTRSRDPDPNRGSSGGPRQASLASPPAPSARRSLRAAHVRRPVAPAGRRGRPGSPVPRPSRRANSMAAWLPAVSSAAARIPAATRLQRQSRALGQRDPALARATGRTEQSATVRPLRPTDRHERS